LSRIERKKVQEFLKNQLRKGYLTIEIPTNITSILCAEERWEEENSTRLLIFEQLNN